MVIQTKTATAVVKGRIHLRSETTSVRRSFSLFDEKKFELELGECYSEIKSFLVQNSGNGNASVRYNPEMPPPAIILRTLGFGFLFFSSGKVVITGNHPIAKHVSVLRFFWSNCLKMHVREK